MGDLQQEPIITQQQEEEENSRRVVQLADPNPNPDPETIGAERWAIAEKSTRKIIAQFQPTVVSEKRRVQVIDYVRRIIRNSISGCELGCETACGFSDLMKITICTLYYQAHKLYTYDSLETVTRFKVFPYGSVPLKTYLPDGDIDLTVFGGASFEEALANNIVSELQREEKSKCAKFLIKEVQLIKAEVKIVKCLVQNVVVDISFNQIGGLCTLCFLEQVDRFIGKDNLFKRSIILIKSWCYYESRILGAHHGLISTYALETLVLYIFQVFHSTLDGPLAVLYKFLDYFSKFDWENYCISLRGPVRVSLLPDIEVETPENGFGELLLTEDFHRYCVDTFSVPSKDVDINTRIFPQKHLNIVDPLKEYNNLGRSVNKGNFYRIRSAFTYGARKLGEILMRPEGSSISAELCTYFSNTLDRHGSGERPDVQDPVSLCSPSITSPVFAVPEIEESQIEKLGSSSIGTRCIGVDGDYKPNPVSLLQDEVYIITALEERELRTANGHQKDPVNDLGSTVLPDSNGGDVPGYNFSGDDEEHATPRNQALHSLDDTQRNPSLSREESGSPEAKVCHAPHHYFFKPLSVSGVTKNENPNISRSENHVSGLLSEVLQGPDKEIGTSNGHALVSEVGTPVRSQDVPSFPCAGTLSENSDNTDCRSTSSNNAACPRSLNSLLDLHGDFRFHFNCLQYGRWVYEYASYISAFPIPRPPPPLFQSTNSWDDIQHSSLPNGFYNGTLNGVIQNPMLYPVNRMIVPVMSLGLEEMPKLRGTGTYFPNMNQPPLGYRPSVVKGRNQAPVRSPRSNGRAFTYTEFPVNQGGVTGFSDSLHSGSPRWKVNPSVNGSTMQPNRVAESVSYSNIPQGTPVLESTRQQRPASLLPQTSSQGVPTSGIQSPNAVGSGDENRCTVRSSYHLKDEDDFPPLSN